MRTGSLLLKQMGRKWEVNKGKGSFTCCECDCGVCCSGQRIPAVNLAGEKGWPAGCDLNLPELKAVSLHHALWLGKINLHIVLCWDSGISVPRPQNADPVPQWLFHWCCLWIHYAVEHQVLIQACWPNGFHHCCISLAAQGPCWGFEARGFVFVCLRMFYSFIPNQIQFSSLLRPWLSAILKWKENTCLSSSTLGAKGSLNQSQDVTWQYKH